MCGIIGITAKEDFSVKSHLISSLKKLEYRGYDSSGFAEYKGSILKRTGDIENLEKELDENLKTKCAIAHTRWATHGNVNEENAHPHTDSENKIFLVHNGIIENYEELKNKLNTKLKTETDTEVVAELLSAELRDKDIHTAIKSLFKQLKGTYAMVFMIKGDNRLYAMKKDSPLCIGIAEDEMILASDVYAFSHITNKAVFFDDYEYAIVSPDSFEIFRYNPETDTISRIAKDELKINIDLSNAQKNNFEKYMIKEIYEEPSAVERALLELKTSQSSKVKAMAGMINTARRVLFLASGTSYHASLIGAYLLSRLGYEAHAVISSEFENFSIVDKDTLIIAVSQSGETMDLIDVLKRVSKKSPRVVSIVNSAYSTIYRMSEISIDMHAGQEICVAATKTFINTLIVLFEIARTLKNHICLDKIAEKLQHAINMNEKKCLDTAERLKNKKDIFVLGNKISYPIAREFALKLKEICYIHAEGMMAGELKHGTIALIEDDVPVFGLIHSSNRERMESSLDEVEARGAKVIRIGGKNSDFIIDDNLNEEEFSVIATTLGYLISYHIARLKGLPIDKPRNLAKSVTVK